MNEVCIEKLITELTAYIRCCLSDYRYQHSCRVATFAEELALRYGYDKKQQRLCYLAGIAHDMCKEKPDSFLLRCSGPCSKMDSLFLLRKQKIQNCSMDALLLSSCVNGMVFIKKSC